MVTVRTLENFIETSAAYILIVEDNNDLRMLYCKALSLSGYKVVEAANGQEALNILRNSESKPRLIILDLMMPVMDGWEFLHERDLDPVLLQIPVVVSSASSENVPTQVRFLRKPITLAMLISVADEYCKAVSK